MHKEAEDMARRFFAQKNLGIQRRIAISGVIDSLTDEIRNEKRTAISRSGMSGFDELVMAMSDLGKAGQQIAELIREWEAADSSTSSLARCSEAVKAHINSIAEIVCDSMDMIVRKYKK